MKYLEKDTRLNAGRILQLKDKRFLKQGDTLFRIRVNYLSYQDIRRTYNIISDLEGTPSFEDTFHIPNSDYDSRTGIFRITTNYNRTLIKAIYANIHGIPEGVFTDYRNKWKVSFDYLTITCTKTIKNPYPEKDIEKEITMYE